MSDDKSFLAGVVAHLNAFAKLKGVQPQDVYVRLTLADGTIVLTRGLDARTHSGGILGMILRTALPPSDSEALVIREGSILKAEFDIAISHPQPIGLHAEAGK